MPRPPAYTRDAVNQFLANVRGGRDRPALVAADGTTEPPLPTDTPDDADR